MIRNEAESGKVERFADLHDSFIYSTYLENAPAAMRFITNHHNLSTGSEATTQQPNSIQNEPKNDQFICSTASFRETHTTAVAGVDVVTETKPSQIKNAASNKKPAEYGLVKITLENWISLTRIRMQAGENQ